MRFIRLFPLALAMWFFPFAVATGQDYLKQGRIYLAQGLYDEALASLKKAEEKDPTDAEVYYYLGLAYSGKGDFNRPLWVYQKAVSKNPSSAQAYCELGVAWQERHNLPKAIECYQKAIRLDPEHIEAYQALAEAYGLAGQHLKDIAYSKRVLFFQPYNTDVYYVSRIPYVRKKIYELAEKNFKKSIQLNPRSLRMYYMLGVFYAKLSGVYNVETNSDKAIECWHKMIAINPKEATTYFLLGTGFKDKGMLGRAEAYLKKALAMGYFDRFGAYAHLQDLYLKQNKIRKLIVYLEDIVSHNPVDGEARYYLAESYRRCGDAQR